MKIIDAHTHVFPQYADLAVQTMDRTGVECMVTLEWHDGFGKTLAEHLKIFRRYPGRFVIFGNVDFRRINAKDFGKTAAEQMERDVAAGMAGIKIYKALGLEYRDAKGDFIRVNDPRLDEIWARAGELNIPVLMHIADPIAFWEPLTGSNFWNGVLYGEYAWWAYYRKNYPSRDELLSERNEVIGRHAYTTFICPHIGSRADNLQVAADDLDRYPNLYYDISARIPILGLPGRHAENTRRFLVEFQDRILFGTDLIYDPTNLPTGMQAQALYQPFEIPLNGTAPEAAYVDSSVAFVKSHIDFLATDRLQERPPFKRTAEGFTMQGIKLPPAVLEKICCRNAERIIKCGG